MNLNNAQLRLAGTNLQGTQVINTRAGWDLPEKGWVKMNVNGAYSMNSGARCGGIIRDVNGRFIMAFMHCLMEGDSLSAKIWAILIGLKSAWDQGCRKLIVESDAMIVVQLIRGGDIRIHPNFQVIEEVRGMLQWDWEMELRFVPRNANKVADFLAKNALSIMTGFHPVLFATPELEAVMHQDYNFMDVV